MDNKSKIACCNICMLADAMKVCKACPFNPANLDNLTDEQIKAVTHVELLKAQVKP